MREKRVFCVKEQITRDTVNQKIRDRFSKFLIQDSMRWVRYIIDHYDCVYFSEKLTADAFDSHHRSLIGGGETK